jgi:tellurite resistance protein
MTARAEYTAEEWQLLRMTPYAAGMAVAVADGIGVTETVRESVALVVAQSEGLKRYPDNELIKSLLFDRSADKPQAAVLTPEEGADRSRMGEQVRDAALRDCRGAVALLGERSPAAERGGYLRWVMDTARAVALAARSGGLFSRGPLVDDAERAVLEEIASALGVEVGELPAADVPTAFGGPASVTDGLTPGAAPPSPDSVPGSANIPSGPITPE